MAVARISVVVPFYNNEDVLGPCLESIAAQTYRDLQVILVDDGSSDGSAAIARTWADADPRCTLIQVPNGGPGYARNRGIELAQGEFLAFLDGDDMLPSHAYEHLLHTLEASGSDFVSGNVERIGPAGITQSALHARAIKGRAIGTHISRAPNLFYDVSVWNKLFRRSFWDRAGLSFPEGVVWEDLQAITKAHVLARAVDVIPDTIYYWRERGAGELSITQSRTDIANFRDRITALQVIDDFLRARGTPKLLRQHQRKSLVNDLWLYVCELSRTTDAYRAEFIELGGAYLRQVEAPVLRSLPAAHKLAYHLMAAGQLDRLVKFDAWRLEQPISQVPLVREHGRVYADMPFRKDRAAKIPGWVYRPHWRELDPVIRVDGVNWENNRLVITGCAFVPSIDIPKRRNTSKVVVLVPRTRLRPPMAAVARSSWYPDAAILSGQNRYSYPWAGFRAEIPARWFRVGARWLTGDWDALILVRGHGVWRPSRLHSPLPGQAERPAFRQVAPGIRIGAWWVWRQLHVGVARTPAVLHGSEQDGTDLVLTVDLDAAPGQPAAGQVPAGQGAAGQGAVSQPADGPAAALVLVRPKGGASRQLPGGTEDLGGGRLRITGRADLAALLGGADQPGDTGQPGPADQPGGTGPAGPVEWDLYAAPPAGRRIRVAYGTGRPEHSYPAGSRELAVEHTRYGNVVLVRRDRRPVVDEHEWSPAGRLTLRGRYPLLPGQDLEAVLRRRTSTDQHVVAVQRDADRFTLAIDATAMPSFGQRVPLRDGIWDIAIRPSGCPGAEMIPAYDHARLADIQDLKAPFGHKTYRFSTSGYDAPIIEVVPVLGRADRSRVRRRVMRGVFYPVQQKLPLRDAVMFVSFKGKQCGDNPGGIAAELRRRGDDREHIWAVNDWAVPVPPGARGVLAGTEEYFEALARCRYVIANDDMQATYTKREGQVYVQTWHGTPLKKIGFDIGQPKFASGSAYLELLGRDVAKWDMLLSPNPFSTPIMRRAFRFDGEILESGYPRNDVLRSGDADRIGAEVRRRIGIPAGQRIVLYAPTWRDNQYYASGRYRFDFRLDLERAWQVLGDDYVVLVRGHHHMADDVPAGTRPGFAVNVTAYPDISELFLISDVLVTDYSSVMFDFAATGRPMVFFTYDLESYRDNLRGFCFDFESEAPGPLLATTGEVAAAIRDIGAVGDQYRGAYSAFAAKFCPLDDGKAGARACDRIFGT
ncbi:MAG: CDP-glycerol glycerophosphotransferase family protein [Streptosporangiaceae bacterium]